MSRICLNCGKEIGIEQIDDICKPCNDFFNYELDQQQLRAEKELRQQERKEKLAEEEREEKQRKHYKNLENYNDK
jgi:hypothetical protein